jgi:hypothetical protein
MIRQFFVQTLRAPRYNNRQFFVIFLVVMAALMIDDLISIVADILSKLAVTFWGVALFIGIAAIYAFGQYFILEMVKAKNKESKVKPPNSKPLEKTVTLVQYVLTAIMVLVVLQIISISHYYTNLLTASTVISYGFTVFLMSILAYRLFSWFKLNRSLVVLLYGLAAGAIIVNALDTIIINAVPLLGKPAIVSPQSPVIFQTGFYPGTAMSIVAMLQSNSVLGYVILTWAGTILLLRHNIRRVGKVKFWILVTLPLIYFGVYNLSLYQSLYPSSPVTTAISSNLMIPLFLLVFATILCGVLFGIGFWSVARFVSHATDVRDYMMITAYGLILFFTAAGAAVEQAGYPPFGLANVSFVGLSSFLILIGLYHSAISVANDVTLRKSIKNSALKESSFLDSIGTAQMTQEIENKVTKMTADNANRLIEQSGIEPSLTDNDIKLYLDKVLEELSKVKSKD